MADDFIQIPSFLTENDSSISPLSCGNCEYSCQYACENYCMDTCEACEGCQTTCEIGCESTCENRCMSCEGAGCQTSCQLGCQSTCENNCQSTCQVNCQTTCEGNCQLACENACQYACENYCMTECESCETACQGTCLDACQVCEGVCQSSCEIYCETCQTTCQKYCQSSCQTGCQSTGQTNPKLPNPTLDTSATVKTGNSITITINPVTGADTYYARINGGSQQSSSERTFTFYGLLPLTQYFIEIKVSGFGYQDSDWVGYYATTLDAELWEWQYPKTSATGFNVTPEEWLAFCNKINVVRISKGLLAYPFTTSSTYIAKGKDFYAWIWLEAANAINEINGQVASACLNVNTKNDIYAWYFDNLKNALNSAIQST